MFIKGLDLDNVVVGMAVGGFGACPFCKKPIEPGMSVAAQEGVFTSHERCFRKYATRLDDQHELSHMLGAALLHTVDQFVAKVGQNRSDSRVCLAAAEQLASVWRRLVKHQGMSREEANAIQKKAIECSAGVFEYMLENGGTIPGTAAAHGEEPPSIEPEDLIEKSPADVIPVETRVQLGKAFGRMTTKALSGNWHGEPEEV